MSQTLSVVLCNYNHAYYLPRALNAIFGQSRLPDEVLLLDDASTDSSVEIMQDYASRYPFIRVVVNEANLGSTKSVVKATALTSGTFVQRLASDDYMLPGFIEKVMAQVERFPEIGIVSTAFAHVKGAQDDGWAMSGVPQRNPEAFFFGLPGCRPGYHSPEGVRRYLDAGPNEPMSTLAPSTIYRRAAVDELGGWPTDLGDALEVSFILQAVAMRYGMVYLDDLLYTWVYREKSITHRELHDYQNMVTICDRYVEKMKEPPFDTIFSDTFRDRWRDQANHMFHVEFPEMRAPPPAPMSRLGRLFRR